MAVFDLIRARTWVHQLQSVALFLVRPRYDWPPESAAAAGIALVPLLVLKMLLAVAAVLSFYVFEAWGVVPELQNEIGSLDWPTWRMLLAGGLLVPFIEEGAFRAHFRLTPSTAGLTVATASYMAISWVATGTLGVREELFDDAAPLRAGAAAALGLGAYVPLRATRLAERLAPGWRRAFPALFWMLIVYFGLIHLGRYSNFMWAQHGPFVPLIILPQVVAATFYTYTRMRYGFGWGLALHGLNNALPTVVFGYLITGELD